MATSKLRDLPVDCVVVQLCLLPNGRWCAHVRTHLSTPSAIRLSHLPRQLFDGFGLPEDYAIGGASLMPRHAAVHSSAPQGMFTFQKFSV